MTQIHRSSTNTTRKARRKTRFAGVLGLSVIGLSASVLGAGVAGAAEPTVGLGTTDQFAVLAGAGVMNTGPSVLVGFDLGVSPGSAVTGFPPGQVSLPGGQHVTDAVAAQAQLDATTAFNDAAGRSPAAADSGLADLVGMKLQPGVYQGDALSLSGTVTLDNNDVPDAVFIFQASSSLITSSSSVVKFTNADHPSCNVFWEVGTSATLGTGSSFVGTLLAKASITATTGAQVQGRLLASVGAVTLDTNRITRLNCAPPTPPSSSSSSPSSSASTPSTASSPPITAPTSAVVVPPVGTTPPPRDVTSGRTVPVTFPSPIVTTSPSRGNGSGSIPGTLTNQTRSTGSSSTSSSPTSITAGTTGPAVALDNGSGTTTSLPLTSPVDSLALTSPVASLALGLAVTGPPVLPMVLTALALLAAGWILLLLARHERRRIGQHRA